ncbi:hypothetical protein RZS08_22725, partial [Arthrospira platensis SPKY1]|nr:hypothetical protein [Arthrospira platensis SPKY1]
MAGAVDPIAEHGRPAAIGQADNAGPGHPEAEVGVGELPAHAGGTERGRVGHVQREHRPPPSTHGAHHHGAPGTPDVGVPQGCGPVHVVTVAVVGPHQ